MKTWNVLTGVEQLVDAESAEEAVQIAAKRIQTAVAGFGYVYNLEELAPEDIIVFESRMT